MTASSALADELEAVNSIYDADTLVVSSDNDSSTSTVLTLPNAPFSFSITFPHDYPDVPPVINGTQSTGPNTKKGDGDAALNVLRDVLGRLFTPGQVCMFDVIEEVTPLLETSTITPPSEVDTTSPSQIEARKSHSTTAHGDPTSTAPPISELSDLHLSKHAAPVAEPDWTISQPLLVSKSSFMARALHITSVRIATAALAHLVNTDKKVASATHNITAWRIKAAQVEGGPEIVVQDCDDDGETAAGGRLLHLMQLMDVWNVMVVVTRWYGGVKLGPDRFRCINMVARDALVRGGFAKDEENSTVAGAKGKKGRKKDG